MGNGLRPTQQQMCSFEHLTILPIFRGSQVNSAAGGSRRMPKAIANNADLDCTYVSYHDGDSNIETRNGSSCVLKQQQV